MKVTTSALLVALGVTVLSSVPPAPAGAEGPRPARVGVIHRGQQLDAPVVAGLRQGLRDLGYVEGRDVVLEVALLLRADRIIE